MHNLIVKEDPPTILLTHIATGIGIRAGGMTATTRAVRITTAATPSARSAPRKRRQG
jgi:hypothetical protein